LQANAFPSYDYGLLASKQTKDLIQLPELTLVKPAEISSSFTAGSADTIRIEIKSVFYGIQADAARQIFTWEGLEEISFDCLLEIQEQWSQEVSLDVPLEFYDDRFNNTITIIESYIIPIENYWTSRNLLLSVMRSRVQRQTAA
jgi:hypothetical protein